MPQKPKSTFEQLLPMILQTVIGVVILLIAWLVVTSLPMIKDISMPLDFTLADLITAIVLTVIIVMIVSFGTRVELRLTYISTKFPQGGTMLKQLMILLSVLIAYYAFRPILMPYLGELSWIYPLVFLVAFIMLFFLLGYNIYTNMEDLSSAFSSGTKSIAQSSGSLICTKCGEKNLGSAEFCSFCGGKLVAKTVATAKSCNKCGAALKPDARFCAGCGNTVEEAGTAPQSDEAAAICRSCGVNLKAGAKFCAGCGATVEEPVNET